MDAADLMKTLFAATERAGANNSPYRSILPEHFDVLFKGLQRAKANGKVSVLQELAFSSRDRILRVAAQAALAGRSDSAVHPVAAVMLSGVSPSNRSAS